MEFIRAKATDAQVKAALPNILDNIPAEWRGTTFKVSSDVMWRHVILAVLQTMTIA